MNKEQYFLISTKKAFDKWNIQFDEFNEQFKADIYFVKANHPVIALIKLLERIYHFIFINENNLFLNEIFKNVQVTNKIKYAKECVKNSITVCKNGNEINTYYSTKHSGISNIIEILFSYKLDYNSLETWYNQFLKFPFGYNSYGPIEIYSVKLLNYRDDIDFQNTLERFLKRKNLESAIWISDWLPRGNKLIRVDFDNY